MTPKTKKLIRCGLKAVGPVLLGVVLATSDWGRLLGAMRRINLLLFVAGYLVGTPMLFVKSLRWRRLVRANPGAELGALRSFGYGFAASFLGIVTPGRVGELFKVGYVRGRGLSFGRAAATVIVDRSFDLAVPLAVVCLGILLVPNVPGAELWQILVAGAMAAGGLLAAVMLWRRVRAVARAALERLSGAERARLVARGVDDFFAAIRAVRPSGWAWCAAMTLAVWAMYCIQRVIMSVAVGMEVDVPYFGWVFLVTAVLSVLPITVAGIGTRDVAFIYFLGQVGVAREEAVVLSSLILLAMLVNMVVGFVVFMFVGSPAGRDEEADPGAGEDAAGTDAARAEKAEDRLDPALPAEAGGP